jgi:hypothetical protein
MHTGFLVCIFKGACTATAVSLKYWTERSSKKDMKNAIMIILAGCMLFAFAGCSKEKDYSSEQGILSVWAQALKNRDYSLYSKTSAYPRTVEQFNEAYKDYFISDVTVVAVSDVSDSLKDSGGVSYKKKEVSFSGYTVTRKDMKKAPLTGKADLYQFDSKPGVWLVANRILTMAE